MKLKLLLIPVLFWAHATVAAELTVEWHKPDQYTDVQTTYVDRDSDSLHILFGRIEQHLQSLADMHFTQGQVLHIRVTDYDMAGALVPQPATNGQEPFMRQKLMNDFPKMVLSYTLTAADGKLLKEAADVTVEGRAIRTEGLSLFPRISRRDQELVGAELTMLNRWFKETFLD